MTKKYNIRAKELSKPRSISKKPSTNKVVSLDDIVESYPSATTIKIMPLSPSKLEKKIKKDNLIPFQIKEKDLKELLRKKVEEGMDENHAYFLYRCKREKKAIQVYYDIITEGLI